MNTLKLSGFSILLGIGLVLLFMGTFQPTPAVQAHNACVSGISIAKEIKGDDVRIFPGGSDVPFQITLTNTGQSTLTQVTVIDPLVPDCARSGLNLAPGETYSYTCTAYNVSQGFKNIAKVNAKDACNNPVNDNDTSTVRIAGISISKQEKGDDSRTVASGSDVPYTITVTNTGEVDLTNVQVSDPLVPDCDYLLASLPAGESFSYTCTAPNVTEGFTNIATVTGDTDGTPVSDQDPSTVKVPGINVSKQAEGEDVRTIQPGEDVSYTITVTNTGEVDLTNIVLTDALVPDCSRALGQIPDLVPGETYSYVCIVHNVTEGFTNVIIAEGEGDGIVVSDSDPSTVKVKEKVYKLYIPMVSKSGIVKYNVSFGYEDLRIEEANDFDYNDWVLSVETDFAFSSINNSTIRVSRVTFNLTPQARGALLSHEYHVSFPPNTFGSNGAATLTIYNSHGQTISTSHSAFNASQLNDFLVFRLTTDAIPPAGSMVNTTEGIAPTPAAETATLVIDFNNTFPFTLSDFGPHGEGLFFEPYLRVIPPSGSRYNIGNGDLRTIVFPIANWKWPEEHVRIDKAYPGITHVGPPTMFQFPAGWWTVYNTCVYGDGIVCPNP
ncbi:MAG: DUF11 domain-containing protein [Anaerolineae bacterium]|jgi:uncharacterized repeat protein (TIGR01451 family)|nr:DUF11 domain-containing protein [Anaerolineae bacterium]MCZ7553099.1 DUF11 domain-containing protein [Anaerolineales bacterium]